MVINYPMEGILICNRFRAQRPHGDKCVINDIVPIRTWFSWKLKAQNQNRSILSHFLADFRTKRLFDVDCLLAAFSGGWAKLHQLSLPWDCKFLVNRGISLNYLLSFQGGSSVLGTSASTDLSCQVATRMTIASWVHLQGKWSMLGLWEKSGNKCSYREREPSPLLVPLTQSMASSSPWLFPPYSSIYTHSPPTPKPSARPIACAVGKCFSSLTSPIPTVIAVGSFSPQGHSRDKK